MLQDIGRGQSTYVYTLKGRLSKGGNRWCTSILHHLLEIKNSRGPSARAKTLILIGDNYSENKSNVNLDFCSELVLRGWFEEVQLLFGPVGHTHNGVDAEHKVRDTTERHVTYM